MFFCVRWNMGFSEIWMIVTDKALLWYELHVYIIIFIWHIASYIHIFSHLIQSFHHSLHQFLKHSYIFLSISCLKFIAFKELRCSWDMEICFCIDLLFLIRRLFLVVVSDECSNVKHLTEDSLYIQRSILIFIAGFGRHVNLMP